MNIRDPQPGLRKAAGRTPPQAKTHDPPACVVAGLPPRPSDVAADPRGADHPLLSRVRQGAGVPGRMAHTGAWEMSVWRVGSKIPLNVYDGDRPVCQCHTPEDAARIVAAMNDPPRPPVREVHGGKLTAAGVKCD